MPSSNLLPNWALYRRCQSFRYANSAAATHDNRLRREPK